MLRSAQRLQIVADKIWGPILSFMKHKENSKDDEGSIWDFLAGLVMGFVGYGILSEIAKRKPKCPVCMTELEYGQPTCHKCKNTLRWSA
jgi:hypothetical protein